MKQRPTFRSAAAQKHMNNFFLTCKNRSVYIFKLHEIVIEIERWLNEQWKSKTEEDIYITLQYTVKLNLLTILHHVKDI